MTLEYVPCKPKELPASECVAAAQTACRINPANAPSRATFVDVLTPQHLAVLTTKFWGPSGVKLTVGFLTPVAAQYRDKILAHMNAWGQWANVSFTYTQDALAADVRIAFQRDGYWSYLGTDILHIPRSQQTMNLQGFDGPMPESEYFRVVRHETGHTCGFPHEHMRPEIVNRLDPAKTVAWGARALGWDAQTVQQQILTPLSEGMLIGTPHADQLSIMCYDLPAEITKDGQPVLGGKDIDDQDKIQVAKLYPKAETPPPPPPPPVVSPDCCKTVQSIANKLIRSLKGTDVNAQYAWSDWLLYFGDIMAIMQAPTTPAKLDASLVLLGKLAKLTPTTVDDGVVAFVSANQQLKDLIVAVLDQYLANPASKQQALATLHNEVVATQAAIDPIAVINLVKLILDLIERFRK